MSSPTINIYLGSSITGSPVTVLYPNNTYTLDCEFNGSPPPQPPTNVYQWLTISLVSFPIPGVGNVNISNGIQSYIAGTLTYNGGVYNYNGTNIVVTFYLPVTGTYLNSSYSSPFTLTYGNIFLNTYIADGGYNASPFISKEIPFLPPPAPIVCFKEDSKILTNKGYISVQELKKGDLIQTFKHDFVPIEMIGKKEIHHIASQERIKDQLYRCSCEKYPQLFEDLVLTGCHCILIDDFVSDEQKKQTSDVNGKIHVTDRKYRLPACVDERTSVYEKPGKYIIYHFALENEDNLVNYGVYANGLLVETCSKRYLKELSNMEMVT